MSQKNVNFLPEDYLDKRLARRTNAICLTLFAVVMVGLVAAFFVSGRQDAEVRDLHEQVSGQFEQAAERIQKFEQLQEHNEQVMRKARLTQMLVEPVPRTILMAELINHMPMSVSLTEMRLDTEQIGRRTQPARTSLRRSSQDEPEEEDEFKLPETRLTLMMTGIAPTDVEVAQLMSSLGQHALFADVNLAFSEQVEVRGNRVRRFQIQAELDQELDLHDHEPTLVRRGGDGRSLPSRPADQPGVIDGQAEPMFEIEGPEGMLIGDEHSDDEP